MRYSIYLLISLVVFFSSCSKSSDKKTTINTQIGLPSDLPGTSFVLGNFPLHKGNQWTYQVIHQTVTRTTTTTSTEPDVNSATDTSYVTITAIADTIANGFTFVRLSASSATSLRFLTYGDDNCYFANLPDGLHRFTDLSHTDSATVLDNTATVIDSPATRGAAWSTPDGVRQWGDFVLAVVPAGNFDCVKQSYSLALSATDNFSANQYYSAKGLIQQVQYLTTSVSVAPGTHQDKIDITIMLLNSTNF